MKKFQHFTESSIVDVDIFDEAMLIFLMRLRFGMYLKLKTSL